MKREKKRTSCWGERFEIDFLDFSVEESWIQKMVGVPKIPTEISQARFVFFLGGGGRKKEILMESVCFFHSFF